jgi:hypothetical protein
MSDKNMNEEMGVNQGTISQIRERHIAYLRKAVASEMITPEEAKARAATYNPEETGLEEFSVDKDLLAAPATTKYATYANAENSRLAAVNPDDIPEGEKALLDAFGVEAEASVAPEIDDDLDIFKPRATAPKFESRGAAIAPDQEISKAATKDLLKIAGKVTEFEKDNADLLPNNWRMDPVLCSESAKIIAITWGFEPELVKSVIQDMG